MNEMKTKNVLSDARVFVLLNEQHSKNKKDNKKNYIPVVMYNVLVLKDYPFYSIFISFFLS